MVQRSTDHHARVHWRTGVVKGCEPRRSVDGDRFKDAGDPFYPLYSFPTAGNGTGILSIDGGQIDKEHREWIGIANRQIQTDIREKTTLIAALRDLIDDNRRRFSDEEALLEKVAYDRLHSKRLKHQVILEEIPYIIEHIDNVPDQKPEMERLIQHWIVDCNRHEDLKIRDRMERGVTGFCRSDRTREIAPAVEGSP